MTGNIEDPLLRIERCQLATQFRQGIDDPHARLAHARPEGGAQPDRARSDNRYVANLVKVLGQLDGTRAHGACASVSADPSSAPSARSTEHEMQVKVGVSRMV